MTGSDHTSRTLLLSKKSPGKILINRGSNSNIDLEANDITTGHSQIKAFDLTNLTSTSPPYDFVSDGLLLGWGLRNDVGIDEHPLTGGVYSVENSADQILRNDVDIHSDNPAEELNFLGYLNGTASSNQGRNFGYPNCFTAWNSSVIPIFNGTVGGQFAIGQFAPFPAPPPFSLDSLFQPTC
jgi:glucose/arabinose dehydrogenase